MGLVNVVNIVRSHLGVSPTKDIPGKCMKAMEHSLGVLGGLAGIAVATLVTQLLIVVSACCLARAYSHYSEILIDNHLSQPECCLPKYFNHCRYIIYLPNNNNTYLL